MSVVKHGVCLLRVLDHSEINLRSDSFHDDLNGNTGDGKPIRKKIVH